jgi:sugar phosphate isomerase/epimerase
MLAEFGMADYFEAVVLSSEHGRRKPDPHLFEVAAQAMGVKPEECAFVGNRQDTDLAGARRAGFGKVVLLRRTIARKRASDDATLAPDHWIDGLEELLSIFPPRFGIRGLGSRRAAPPSTARWQASISTMWGSPGFPDLDGFLRSAAELGFSGIELNHEVNSAMLVGADLSAYHFSSVHEPCPADISTSRMAALDWQLSSDDEDKRRRAVRIAKRSIHLARDVGAALVVVHPGNVRGDGAIEQELRALFNAGKIDSVRGRGLREQLLEDRGRSAARRMEAAVRSLSELLACAREEGIILGLENRYHYLDIPTPDEMSALLACGEPRELGVVYDVGHALAMDRLGFFAQDEWLERFADRIVEVHLHDVRGVEDHLAPGLGEVDFDRIAARLPRIALRTCELRPRNSPQQVAEGMEFLVRHGCVEPVGPAVEQPHASEATGP